MKLHVKVFLLLTTLLICGFLYSGYIVFSSALHLSAPKDTRLLASITRLLADELNISPPGQIDHITLKNTVISAGTPELTTLLVNHSGQVIAIGPSASNRMTFTGALPATEILQPEPNSGDFFIGLDRFLWASYPLTNTPFTFVVVHAAEDITVGSYFRSLTVPIIVMIILILAYAYWCINMQVALSRKLDLYKRELLDHRFLDPVTQLPRRALFQDRVEQNLQLSQREGRSFVILAIYLNPLAEVLDGMNPQMQTQVVRTVSAKLQETLRDSDTFSYAGECTFLAHLPSTDGGNAKIVSNKLVDAFRGNITTGEHTYCLHCHIGICVYPSHGNDADTLINNALLAMNVCTQANNSFILYDKSLDYFNVQRLSFINNLRKAISLDKLELFFQPKIEMRTGLVIGAEALIRWQYDDGTLVLPDEFIPIAEQTGLITPLTQWVLNNALLHCAKLHQNIGGIHIAVNISAYNLQDHLLEQVILTQLNTWKIDPRYLCLEITESAMMRNQARAMELLNRITSQGIRIAVDDFGTGYSSLNYLRKLPLHELKIDKNFVINMAHNKDDAIIVQSIIDLAHDMGLQVVAEGIENKESLDRLLDMGCDIGQGYYFSPPMNFEEFLHWLNANGTYQAAAVS